MAKAPKATHKSQKKHLKRSMDQQKIAQQYKEKVLKDKKKSKTSSKSKREETEDNENEVIESGSVESFFNSQADEIPIQSPKKKKSKSKSQLSADDLENEKEDYKESMEKLAEKDPEFYKYLKENDEALLDFDISKLSDDESDQEDDQEDGQEDDENQDDDQSSDDNEVLEEKSTSKKPQKQPEDENNELTLATVKAWKKSLEAQKSIKTIKKVLLAFKGAVHASESKDEEASQFTLTNPEVFNALLFLTLKTIPEAVQHNIPLATSSSGTKYVSTENKRFKTLSASLKSHASALAALLADIQDKDIANLVLKSVHSLLPYFLSFRKPIKELMEAVVNLWGSSADDETKMVAFAFLKTAAEEHSKSLLEIVLKSTYAGILKNSRRTNVHTMPGLNFQKNSAATLFEIDASLSYQLSFQFIRQLAVHLRSSIVNKTADSYKSIYNWQYANSLDFWSRVLAAQCDVSIEVLLGKPSPLRELVYPLVQVTLGAIRLIPTPQYFPFRFYLIRSLLRLSQSTGVFIPLLPLLTELLNSTAITKSPKASTLKALDFDHNIRANKSYIGTRIYQDGLCDELIDLVGEFFVLHCKSLAFPELAVPAIITFKRFTKKSKNAKFNKQIQRLIERLEENSKFVQQKRKDVAFGPTDTEQVAAFLKDDIAWENTPLGSYVVVQRQVKAEKAKILRDSLEADDDEQRGRGGRGSDGEVGISDLEDDKSDLEPEESDDEEMSD